MEWTDEKPVTPGCYWLRSGPSDHGVNFVDYYSGTGELVVWLFEGGRNYTPLSEIDGYQWAGPIPEPTEPKP